MVRGPPRRESPKPGSTEIGRFLEAGGNTVEELVFNSATGKLEIVLKEESTRPGREVVSNTNRRGAGGVLHQTILATSFTHVR